MASLRRLTPLQHQRQQGQNRRRLSHKQHPRVNMFARLLAPVSLACRHSIMSRSLPS